MFDRENKESLKRENLFMNLLKLKTIKNNNFNECFEKIRKKILKKLNQKKSNLNLII